MAPPRACVICGRLGVKGSPGLAGSEGGPKSRDRKDKTSESKGRKRSLLPDILFPPRPVPCQRRRSVRGMALETFAGLPCCSGSFTSGVAPLDRYGTCLAERLCSLHPFQRMSALSPRSRRLISFIKLFVGGWGWEVTGEFSHHETDLTLPSYEALPIFQAFYTLYSTYSLMT